MRSILYLCGKQKYNILRYFIQLAYLGKNYSGWQYQPNAKTVQETLNNALQTILRENTEAVGAGRTDAGVHAGEMVAHVDIEKTVVERKLVNKLNGLLPNDIVIKNIYPVADVAHARFSAVSRSYEYRIWLGRNPFMLDTAWQLHHQVPDVNKMNKAAVNLLKYTNFKCFSKSNTDVKTYNCDIYKAEWRLQGKLLVFQITADRFLRNMVRAIVGTLIDIGLGKRTTGEIVEILESEDRSKAGFSVPAHGLFLTKVAYPDEIVKIDYEQPSIGQGL